ncbi:MAG: hypothetical protein ACOCQ4_00150 [bacterium]
MGLRGKKIRAVLLGGGPTALAGIRELGINSVDTYVITISNYEVSRYSKYAKYIGTYDFEKNEDELVSFLLKFSSKKSIDILIPSGDESVKFLSNNKEKLESKYKSSIFENDVTKLLINKKEFSKICEKIEVSQPKTWHKDKGISIENWSYEVNYPCLIKPVYYHLWKEKYGLKKGFVVNDANQLVKTYNDVSRNISDLIIQEVIEGEDDNIVIFSANFKSDSVDSIFTGRKIRQFPYGFGTTTFAKQEFVSEIINSSLKLLKHINYIGPCDVEFKFDKKTKQYKIIEVNSRIPRWYSLVTSSGKQPLFNSVLFLANIDTNDNNDVLNENIYWYFGFRDFLVFNKNLSYTKTLKTLFSRNITYCIWDKSDILPFFTYFIEVIYKLFKK